MFTLKLLFIFKIWFYQKVFDVIKNVCELFDDCIFNTQFNFLFMYIPLLNITLLPYSIKTQTSLK